MYICFYPLKGFQWHYQVDWCYVCGVTVRNEIKLGYEFVEKQMEPLRGNVITYAVVNFKKQQNIMFHTRKSK